MIERLESPRADARDSAVTSFFDELAGRRNAIFRSNPVLEYEQEVRSRVVLDLLAVKPGDVVLDIGCGNARDIVPMARQGATVVGIDLAREMIEQARLELAAVGISAVTLEVGDATRLKYQSAAFDKVLCSEVIEHIPDVDAALAEIHRVLKPGGVLVLSTPNRRSWYGLDRFLWERVLRRAWDKPFDHWRSMHELVCLIEKHGFELTSRRTASYLPGFLLTYSLPGPLQRGIVRCVRRMEGVTSRLIPSCGYMLVITAIRCVPPGQDRP